MSDLHPCPFCGEAENLQVGDNDIGEPHVYCKACGCGGPAAVKTDTQEEAITLWNTRFKASK